MTQKEELVPGPRRPPPAPPQAAEELWEDDVDDPAGEVTPANQSVEVLVDLVSDPARAAVVAERLEALEAKVAAAVVRSRAPATLRAYRSDWKDFAVFCEQLGVDALPASPAVVAGYVAELADPPDDRSPARVSTITRRLAAIGEGHKVGGHPNPCTDPLVRETMKGVRRSLGVAPTQKKGITTGDVKAAVAALPPGLAGHRDRLLLTLGFAGGFRRSELAGITVADVEQVAEGLLVHLDRSKTDQEGKGRRVEIVYGTDAATCPVRAWRTWLTASAITTGQVFRRIDRHDRLLGPLSPQGVALVVKRHMGRLGHTAGDFAGHSLRRGHATTAARNGASERTIMRTTGHTSTQTVRGYIEDGELFSDPASKYLGL